MRSRSNSAFFRRTGNSAYTPISLPERRRDKITWSCLRSFARGHAEKQQRTQTFHSRNTRRRVEAIHGTLPHRWLAVVSAQIAKDLRDGRSRQTDGDGNNRAEPRPACRNAEAALRRGTLGGAADSSGHGCGGQG